MHPDFSREEEGAGNLPALQLGHGNGRIGEAAGGIVVQKFIESPAEFTSVQAGEIQEASEFGDGDMTGVSE